MLHDHPAGTASGDGRRAEREHDGDAPMTNEQSARLKKLAREKGMKEAFEPNLSKAGAEQRISIIGGKPNKAGSRKRRS